MRFEDCPHTDTIDERATPRADACEDCGRGGPIRMCATCGYVGCCESSAGHDKAHFEETGHPIIRELPLSDASFTWCYECRDYLR